MKTTDPFRSVLLDISQEITTRNLADMKYACDNDIPDGVLEKLKTPVDLFTELQHRDLLSEENKEFLARLLLKIGRQELARKLLGMNENAWNSNETCIVLRGVLPGKVPHFLGRALICEEIIAYLIKDHDRLVTITGPPGYGKSAVAISIGHEMMEQQHFNVYYVSIRGASSVDSIAFQLLYSMGVVSSQDPISQSHHYFESLIQKTLLIFDNVEDFLIPAFEFNFRKFIRLLGEMAPHVYMIITSRVAIRFLSFNMKNVALPALSDREAAQLIRIFSPQEISNNHAMKLGQLCKGVPLLIRTVSSLLETNVDPDLLIKEFDLSPGTAMRRLSWAGISPESDMYPCLKICFERLNPELQNHLIALSVFPSSFKIPDTSCVLRDMSDLQRQLIITQLVDSSFVRPHIKERSFYAIHSIVLIFCKELLKEKHDLQELYENARRHFNLYFLTILKDMNTKFYGNGEDLQEVLAAFECHKNNIFRALEGSIHDKKLVNYAADILNSSFKFFTVRLSSSEFTQLYKSFLQIFEKNMDRKRYSDCLVSLGFHQFWVMCTCVRPCHKATQIFKKAFDLQKELGMTKSEQHVECLSKLARSYAFEGPLANSVILADEAKTIAEEIKTDNLTMMSVFNDYAAVYSYHKHHKTAIELRERILPMANKEIKDNPSIAMVYEELGSSYEAIGRTKKSMECRREAIRIYEGFLGDHKFTATSYLGLGKTLKSLGNHEGALAVLRQALEIQRRTIGPHDETVMTSEEIEKVYRSLGRVEEAESAARFTKKLNEDKKRIEKAMEDLKI